jgi:hypothetical protein
MADKDVAGVCSARHLRYVPERVHPRSPVTGPHGRVERMVLSCRLRSPGTPKIIVAWPSQSSRWTLGLRQMHIAHAYLPYLYLPYPTEEGCAHHVPGASSTTTASQQFASKGCTSWTPYRVLHHFIPFHSILFGELVVVSSNSPRSHPPKNTPYRDTCMYVMVE